MVLLARRAQGAVRRALNVPEHVHGTSGRHGLRGHRHVVPAVVSVIHDDVLFDVKQQCQKSVQDPSSIISSWTSWTESSRALVPAALADTPGVCRD